MSRKIYIIIHGTGSTLRQTAGMLAEIDSIKAKWWDGIFYTNKKTGLLLRKILSDADESSALFNAARKIIASRLLRACETPEKPENPENFSTIDEARIIDNFADFDIPYGPKGRKRTCERLEREGEKEFLDCFGQRWRQSGIKFAEFMSQLQANLLDEDGAELTEEEAFAKIAAISGNENIAKDLVELRDMSESGADLDTVSSATFYAHGLKYYFHEQGQIFLQGLDYQFAFINYHQGLQPLVEEFPEPGDIYMADIPISTIPDLPSDLTALTQKGYRLIRYEDHHPYTEEQFKMLEELQKQGFINYFAMSGPVQGQELPQEALKCGGDMVYESLIMGQSWDTPAMAYLRKCVHGEDLAQERTDEGKLLTDLIKGGTNSIEIIQTLLSCRREIDIALKLEEKGWAAKIAKEREEIKKIENKFKEAIQVVEIERPPEDKGSSGEAMGYGSDMPAAASAQPKDKIKIIISLAPYTSKNEPKLKIGKAQEYFSREMPDADYLLFCYGSSLIVGRRLNQADFSLNLSVLMRKIGTESDGGHAGAAVCGPEKNPNYPKTILGHVNKGNFKLYCRYLEKIIAETLDVKVISRKDFSEMRPTKTQESGMWRLIALSAATVILGLAVIILNPDYRPAKIAELNKKDFFVWFGKEAAASQAAQPESDIDETSNERLNSQ